MSKTKNTPDNDIVNIQPDPVKETRTVAEILNPPEPDKKPRRQKSLNLQLASKIDLILQQAEEAVPGGDLAILEFLAKDRGWILARNVSPSEVFDRR